jgi:NAD(P)-dependent dehydrogenase (short-subunit alcohol dehydrogenase family)
MEKFIDLSEKVILLTGASGGIGIPVTKTLANLGANLIAQYGTNKEPLENALEGIPEERKLLVQTDFTREGETEKLWDRALAWKGRIDVLILNAGILVETPFEGDDDVWNRGWRNTIAINLLEPAYLMKKAVMHYMQRGGGIIITVSSWVTHQGSAIASLPAYAASKAAIRAVAHTIARNYGRYGILSYVVAPGIVDTPMSNISVTSRGGMESLKAVLPLGEMVPPQEVANVIAFLASGKARHLTGSTLDVNGAAYAR